MDEHVRIWKMEDVKIDNVTDSVGALGIAGPHSANVLASLTDVSLSDDEFPFLHARKISVSGIPVTALRVSYTGELGWELYHDRKHTAALYSQLLRFGEPYGIKDFGTYALNSLRIEKGFRLWGADMTVDTNPFEAGLGPFVRMKKPSDFVGKAALQQILSEGLSRKLVHLAVDAPDVDPEGNETVWCSDKASGRLHNFRILRSPGRGKSGHGICPNVPRYPRKRGASGASGQALLGHSVAISASACASQEEETTENEQLIGN
ncbi:hypothetical protein HPB50_001694 [Hyalomma asiaticum]|uniref:Uncharacterized protein n=1 Tax=Hyalomma asiaticum TaxID=266040 RepID=A0ACB7SU82_HYAAI|nr:hypothetical protein HPB50_001694 [Hyalomma asiaticum]